MAEGEQRPLLSKPLLPSDHPHHVDYETTSLGAALRRRTRRFLTSKPGHYTILFMVSVDITSIFAEFLITLLACEGRVRESHAETAEAVLGVVGLVFSCLFLLELIASVWAFGWKYADPCAVIVYVKLTGHRFFNSWFHALDAAVILAGFVIDVLLKGVLEEIGSLVVVLRFWRVFKIIEELSAGAEEQMEPLQEKILDLEEENRHLRREMDDLRSRNSPL